MQKDSKYCIINFINEISYGGIIVAIKLKTTGK